ncbi:hypothetical protein CSUB01_00758 [Colletotrichum sublineola]|uniref:Uncharacterized protein n=1 Tax=Colletotrichum sublineola TaxID=1173701 RepID=A0A066WXJ6_COLSU|nr:hypothetical protein CSUB01_00758 [Colletotrichum sublineola]
MSDLDDLRWFTYTIVNNTPTKLPATALRLRADLDFGNGSPRREEPPFAVMEFKRKAILSEWARDFKNQSRQLFQGGPPSLAPAHILVFTECEEIQVYYSGAAAAFNEKGLISVIERFLSNTLREIITEQVVAVATNTRKHQRVQLALRADIAHFLILIPVTLRMGVATTHKDKKARTDFASVNNVVSFFNRLLDMNDVVDTQYRKKGWSMLCSRCGGLGSVPKVSSVTPYYTDVADRFLDEISGDQLKSVDIATRDSSLIYHRNESDVSRRSDKPTPFSNQSITPGPISPEFRSDPRKRESFGTRGIPKGLGDNEHERAAGPEDTTTIYDLPAEKAKTDEKQAYGRKHMHAIMRQLVDILDVIKSTMTKTEIKTAVEKGREMQQREPAFGHPQSSFTSAYNDDNKDVFYLHTNNLIRYHSDSEKETWMGTPL